MISHELISVPMPALTPTVQRIVTYFEALTTESVAQIATFYDPQVRFKDPFKDVRGLAEIKHIFEHMFVSLEAPRFIITGQIVQGQQCFLTWEFRFKFRNFQREAEQTILGGSHLQFSDQGLITLHRDYWDAAEELYEKLPLVGSLMRWLKKRANS
jgi:hypothetical protein